MLAASEAASLIAEQCTVHCDACLTGLKYLFQKYYQDLEGLQQVMSADYEAAMQQELKSI